MNKEKEMIPHVYTAKKENEELESEYDFDKAKNVKWHDQVLLNRPAKVVTVLFLVAIVCPLLLYRFLFFTSRDIPPSDGFSVGSCLIPRDARLPCGIGYMTEAECHQQCCFDMDNGMCFHRFPSRFSYIIDRDWSEDENLQPRVSTVPYGFQNSITNIKLSIDEQSPTHLTLTFYDSRDFSLTGKRIENKTYVYAVTSPELSVIVNSSQGTVFNTARGPLIASNNIWEITFQLTNETLYGLGELPLKPGSTKVLYNHKGGLSSIPLIFAKINDSYHGVLIDSISPTEVSVNGNNQLIVRSITKAGLKLHIFMGPQPKNVMSDVMNMIGHEMKLEYWMLGAHFCSETSESLKNGYEDLQNFTNYANRDKIPYDSHCGVGPIIFDADQCDTAETEYIQKGIDLLKQEGKRFVPHVSPYVRFNKNLSDSEESGNRSRSDEDCYKVVSDNEQLFYRYPSSHKLYQGIVGNDKVIYPSYKYGTKLVKEFWKYEGYLDAVILENSWPLDQSIKKHDENEDQVLPYISQDILNAFDETPPVNLQLMNNSQIYLQNHNTYGNNFTNAFLKSLNVTTPVWSSSQWMNLNVVINRQGIDTTWANLHQEMIQAALGGISGHWLWSSPTCGDTDNFDIDNQANLCVKWYMANTFSPVLKIHSRNKQRDPLIFPGTQKHLIIGALIRRLSLLPYLYTTLQQGPILRPMFFQFPNVKGLANINTQFSVGDDLVVVPNLQPLQRFVHLWLPPGVWYELWSGLKLEGEVGQAVTMSTTESDFLIVIRGGAILVMQKDTRETAQETRLHSDMSLTIALECNSNGTECEASGQLFVEDETAISFAASENKLTINIEGLGTRLLCDPSSAILANTIDEIYVFGLNDELNNYDHAKHIQTRINLCTLEVNNEFPLI